MNITHETYVDHNTENGTLRTGLDWSGHATIEDAKTAALQLINTHPDWTIESVNDWGTGCEWVIDIGDPNSWINVHATTV